MPANGNTFFKRVLLPGFLFQSVVIGGGYATGRELVEFFLSRGPAGGLLGIVLAGAAFSVIAAMTFEVARRTRSYNYRRFFKQLLGRGWFLFEIAYLLLGILVMAVIGAASGEVVAQHLGLDATVGIVSLMALIAVLVFFGSRLIEKVLAGWSFLLYAVYGVFVLLFLLKYGDRLPSSFSSQAVEASWVAGSLQYVGYSMAAIPVILFCVKHMESRRDALMAGIFAGPLGMFPALLFYVAMVATYPEILSAPVPADFMMQQLSVPLLKAVFYVVIFGTFVETGTAFVHAINERIDSVFAERKRAMPPWLRPAVALGLLLVSVLLAARIGLIDLIASGYGTLTWAIIAIYLVPLFTVGVYRLISRKAWANAETF